jgi:hypothetical protein
VGSWPAIGAGVALFLIAFFALRHRSTFLAIERERAAATALAAAHGLTLPDAFALRDLVGVAAPPAAWQAAAARFAAARPWGGGPRAPRAHARAAAAAEAARAAAADAAAAWERFRSDARALPGLRFLALRERFAARIGSRD